MSLNSFGSSDGDTMKQPIQILGFPGVTLERYASYSGRASKSGGYWICQNNERMYQITLLEDASGQIRTHDNKDSVYYGYPLLVPDLWRSEYLAYFSGKPGEDYILIATLEGPKVLLIENGEEREINFDDRIEQQSQTCDMVRESGYNLVGLHPEGSLVVLVPKSSTGGTSHYRYYGIKEEGGLIYLGSKNNIASTKTCQYDLRHTLSQDMKRFTLLMSADRKHLAFMLNGITLVPVRDQEGQYQLLRLRTEAYRELSTLTGPNITIPPEWVENDTIKPDYNLRDLIGNFPGTNIPYIPGTIAFSDIYGDRFMPEKVNEIPTFDFGDGKKRYLVRNPEGGVRIGALEDEQGFDVPWQYPPIRFHDTPGKPTLPIKATDKGGNTFYVFSQKTTGVGAHYAVFLGNDGNLAGNYVWYDAENASVRYLQSVDGDTPVFSSREYTTVGDVIVMSAGDRQYVFDKNTGAPVNIPEYPGIRIGQAEGALRYVTLSGEYVKCHKTTGKPLTVSVDGKDYYRIDEEHWPVSSLRTVEGNIRVVHLYDPTKDTVMPFGVKDKKYSTILPSAIVPEGSQTIIQGEDIYLSSSPNDGGRYSVYRFEKIIPQSNDKDSPVVIHGTISSEGQSFGVGTKYSRLVNPKGGAKSELYLLEGDGGWECSPIGENEITLVDNGVQIEGVVHTDTKFRKLVLELYPKLDPAKKDPRSPNAPERAHPSRGRSGNYWDGKSSTMYWG